MPEAVASGPEMFPALWRVPQLQHSSLPWVSVKCRLSPLPPTPVPCPGDSDLLGLGNLDVTAGSE